MSAHMVPIGEVVDFIGGGTPSRDVDNYWNGEIPWASVKDFKGPSIDSTLESITHDGLSASSSALIPAGHVIMPTRMALGKAAINSVDVAINQDLKALKPKTRIDTRYLLHAILSRAKEIQSHGKGATVQGITIERLRAIPIPLPPLEEQRRIAAILDRAQDIKAKVSQRSCLLQALARSLFVRRFGLPSENPRDLPVFKLVDICNPKQWPTISSKQLLGTGYPVFGANGLIGYFDRFNHPDPTVLVTCRGATCGTVNISPPNCYVTGNSMAMDDPDPGLITTEYLAWVLRLRGMHDVISGSAQPQITRQGLEAVAIPVPPIEAQRDFANELRAVARIDNRSRLSEGSLSDVSKCLGEQLIGGSRA
jgi:restriction endonuclease S subunit